MNTILCLVIGFAVLMVLYFIMKLFLIIVVMGLQMQIDNAKGEEEEEKKLVNGDE